VEWQLLYSTTDLRSLVISVNSVALCFSHHLTTIWEALACAHRLHSSS
jgi:hypothetical protein